MSKKISFRGQLADGGIDKIKLSTMKGKKGYKIAKFQLMGPNNNTDFEHVVKIYKVKQSTATSDIDFTDGNLLASGIIGGDSSRSILTTPVIVFDNEVFNQDIYVTNKGHDNTANVNYYIELEVKDISDLQATQLTLKSLRTLASR